MTIGIVLMKGHSEMLEHTYEFLLKMKEKEPKIHSVFLSMGWPDIVLLIESPKVIEIYEKINRIRSDLRNRKEECRDFVDTSTIICIRENERKKMEKEIAEYVAKFDP